MELLMNVTAINGQVSAITLTIPKTLDDHLLSLLLSHPIALPAFKKQNPNVQTMRLTPSSIHARNLPHLNVVPKP